MAHTYLRNLLPILSVIEVVEDDVITDPKGRIRFGNIQASGLESVVKCC